MNQMVYAIGWVTLTCGALLVLLFFVSVVVHAIIRAAKMQELIIDYYLNRRQFRVWKLYLDERSDATPNPSRTPINS